MKSLSVSDLAYLLSYYHCKKKVANEFLTYAGATRDLESNGGEVAPGVDREENDGVSRLNNTILASLATR